MGVAIGMVRCTVNHAACSRLALGGRAGATARLDGRLERATRTEALVSGSHAALLGLLDSPTPSSTPRSSSSASTSPSPPPAAVATSATACIASASARCSLSLQARRSTYNRVQWRLQPHAGCNRIS